MLALGLPLFADIFKKNKKQTKILLH